MPTFEELVDFIHEADEDGLIQLIKQRFRGLPQHCLCLNANVCDYIVPFLSEELTPVIVEVEKAVTQCLQKRGYRVMAIPIDCRDSFEAQIEVPGDDKSRMTMKITCPYSSSDSSAYMRIRTWRLPLV